MNTCFKNARILTMKTGEEIFEGSLYTQDDRIVYVGEALTADEEAKVLPAGYKADKENMAGTYRFSDSFCKRGLP